jgi:cell division topological specificity factor
MKNIFELLKLNSKKSAKIAKERLQIVVSHQRVDSNTDTDFMPKLRQELIMVISKYINIDPEKINVQLQKDGSCSILELNVALPNSVE